MDGATTKILLVDDDFLDRKQVRLILAKSNLSNSFEIEDASTLSEACRMLADNNYDIVLLDLHLGDSSGLDTVKRARSVNSDASVIVLTGLDDEQTGLEAIREGADDYIVKGDTLKQLLARAIRYSLERRRIRKRLLDSEDGHRRHLEQMVRERTVNLEQVNEQMRKEIEDRKQAEKELMQAKQQAEAANKAKSEFLANISHELRTPLHSVLSFASFGIKKYADSERKKLLDYFTKIKQSGQTLLDLLNNLLDLAKLESKGTAFTLSPTDLDFLAKSIISEVQPLISERNLRIRYEIRDLDERVLLDSDKIKQVFRNILNNAVKFSPKGKTIDVAISRTHVGVKVSVSDSGPGVPNDELEAVFDKFVQSSKTKTGAGGTGLGLSISYEIINAHGGRIWAENKPEGGAVFSFEIPFNRDRQEQNEVLPVNVDTQAIA